MAKEQLWFSVDDATKAAIKKMAKDENRSLSNAIETLVKRGLAATQKGDRQWE